jgi:hypothetical protein
MKELLREEIAKQFPSDITVTETENGFILSKWMGERMATVPISFNGTELLASNDMLPLLAREYIAAAKGSWDDLVAQPSER